ncbi:hypothetical protein B7494_g2167 [Chlorociboria aeruginascens]|nr:hypothetical protein B7494_g2167 [Chlorociboria aeruginascens]
MAVYGENAVSLWSCHADPNGFTHKDADFSYFVQAGLMKSPMELWSSQDEYDYNLSQGIFPYDDILSPLEPSLVAEENILCSLSFLFGDTPYPSGSSEVQSPVLSNQTTLDSFEPLDLDTLDIHAKSTLPCCSATNSKAIDNRPSYVPEFHARVSQVVDGEKLGSSPTKKSRKDSATTTEVPSFTLKNSQLVNSHRYHSTFLGSPDHTCQGLLESSVAFRPLIPVINSYQDSSKFARKCRNAFTEQEKKKVGAVRHLANKQVYSSSSRKRIVDFDIKFTGIYGSQRILTIDGKGPASIPLHLIALEIKTTSLNSLMQNEIDRITRLRAPYPSNDAVQPSTITILDPDGLAALDIEGWAVQYAIEFNKYHNQKTSSFRFGLKYFQLGLPYAKLVGNIVKVISINYVLYHGMRIVTTENLASTSNMNPIHAQFDTLLFHYLCVAEAKVKRELQQLIFKSAGRLPRDAIPLDEFKEEIKCGKSTTSFAHQDHNLDLMICTFTSLFRSTFPLLLDFHDRFNRDLLGGDEELLELAVGMRTIATSQFFEASWIASSSGLGVFRRELMKEEELNIAAPGVYRPRNRQGRPQRLNDRGRGRDRGRGGNFRGRDRPNFGTSSSLPNTNQVIPGAAVSIVLKIDQPTGREVHGLVQDILTSGNHPRGIKVRLVDGRVGRVQRMVTEEEGKAGSEGLSVLGSNGEVGGEGIAGNATSGVFGAGRGRLKYRAMREEEMDGPRNGYSLEEFLPVGHLLRQDEKSEDRSNKALRDETSLQGLFMLYGAGYFTEEEWVKLDFLIHKGKYVFTQGSPTDVSNEPLMTFEEPMNNANGYIQIDTTSGSSGKESPVVTTKEIPSRGSSQTNSQSENTTDTPNVTSAEAPEEEHVASKPTDDALFDFAEISERSASPEPAKQQFNAPSEGGDKLPPGCTQEQLDEVKRFNAGLTKAGQKSRPKYDVQLEEETRIKSWASEVDVEAGKYSEPIQYRPARASQPIQPSSTNPEIASPTPSSSSKKPNPEELAKKFAIVYEDKLKTVNDFYQLNNPEVRPEPPKSLIGSMTTTKTNPATTSKSRHGSSKLKVPLGTVLVAQSGVSKKSSINIEVLPGDHIRLVNFVSGITHTGVNLRTNETGHIPDTIFKKAPSNKASDLTTQKSMISSMRMKPNMDSLERVNAAEWDDAFTDPKLTAVAVRKSQGLGASRFSVANMDDDAKTSVSRQGITESMVRDEVKKMFDQQIEEFRRANGMLATIPTVPRATSHRHNSSAYKEPEKPIPKTHTCWFWSTPGKTCRFTAEECRDLHAEGGRDPYLQKGKPTWGALVDYLPSPTASETSPITPPSPFAANASSEKNLTCWYWAQGNCVNTAQTCKYVHAFTYSGVARRPWHKPTQWKLETWKRGEEEGEANDDEQAEGEGDFVLEEATSVWGRGNDVPAWESEEFQHGKSWSKERPSREKYQPPHVKAQHSSAVW